MRWNESMIWFLSILVLTGKSYYKIPQIISVAISNSNLTSLNTTKSSIYNQLNEHKYVQHDSERWTSRPRDSVFTGQLIMIKAAQTHRHPMALADQSDTSACWHHSNYQFFYSCKSSNGQPWLLWRRCWRSSLIVVNADRGGDEDGENNHTKSTFRVHVVMYLLPVFSVAHFSGGSRTTVAPLAIQTLVRLSSMHRHWYCYCCN